MTRDRFNEILFEYLLESLRRDDERAAHFKAMLDDRGDGERVRFQIDTRPLGERKPEPLTSETDVHMIKPLATRTTYHVNAPWRPEEEW
jgi:hypothetical protein